MKLRSLMVVGVAVLLFGAVAGALAQEQGATTQMGDIISLLGDKKSVVAEAVGDMNLRDSPPKSVAAWFSNGSKIGLVKSGEKLKIVGYKVVQTPFDRQRWLEVAPVNPDEASWKAGWVYYGGDAYVKPLQSDGMK
jgi:hypothetical protein